MHRFLINWRSTPWDYVRGVCRNFLGNTAVLEYIRSQHYDVAIVDLIQNECMLALPVSMGVPVVDLPGAEDLPKEIPEEESKLVGLPEWLKEAYMVRKK